MKRFLITSILAAIVAAGTILTAQERPDEYLGLPGDNLNLYAVMKLFQESETLEGFERSLNDENSRINNLDLNGDNLVDYLKVIDYVDGDVHTIVLQAVLDRKETQDVAVFTVQRFNDGSVQIQLTGDDALYGKNYIIEPIMDETPNPGYTGRADNSRRVEVVRTTTVQIAAWPVVRFIYLPSYVVWRSSWYWGYYPGYWHTWRPYYWDYYYGYHYHWFPDYYRYYHHWNNHRYTRWNDFYYNGHRSYSRNVAMRINEGRYKTTYSHPEQRRDGEALYAKVHPERASSISSGNNNSRRSVSQSPNNGRQEGTTVGTSRRSGGSVNSSSEVSRSSGQNNRATSRSTTTVNNRANTNSSGGQSTVTNRRSSETVTTRSTSRPDAVQNSGNARRSSETVTTRSTSRPDAVQNSGNARRSSETATNRSVSRPETGQRAGTSRRSSEGSKTQPAAKSSKSKESDKSTSSRRK